MLFFGLAIAFAPKPSIDDIITFTNDISKDKIDIDFSYFNWIINNPELSLVPIAVWLGALYPDIDFYWLLRKYHRKLLHNILAVVIPAFIIILISARYDRFYNGLLIAGAFSLGCGSHIAADCITPTGCYLLYPFSKEYRRKGPITTGSREEAGIMKIIFVIFILYILAFIAVLYLLPLL